MKGGGGLIEPHRKITLKNPSLIRVKTQRKKYFQDITKKSLVTNKSFWSFMKPFLAKKSCHTQNDIILIDTGKVTEESD